MAACLGQNVEVCLALGIGERRRGREDPLEMRQRLDGRSGSQLWVGGGGSSEISGLEVAEGPLRGAVFPPLHFGLLSDEEELVLLLLSHSLKESDLLTSACPFSPHTDAGR